MMSHRFTSTAYGMSRLGEDWRAFAECRDEDPELFQPIGNTGPAVLQIEQAKDVCRRCPVLADCRKWALESGLEHGVAGGLDEWERAAIRRKNRMKPTVPATIPEQRLCVNGHQQTKANIYLRPNGTRECRECRNTAYAPKQRGKKAVVS